ncbi:MAG: hypothetical protein ABIG87_00330 [Patescibacteria group bacterium]
MKKVVCLIVAVGVLFLVGCTSAPITKKSYNPQIFFTIKFPNGEDLQKEFFIHPGRKYFMDVHPKGWTQKQTVAKKRTHRLVPIGDGFEFFYRAHTTRAIDKMLGRMNKK